MTLSPDSPGSPDSSLRIFDPDEILAGFGGRNTFTPYADYLLAENQKINLVSRETSPGKLFRLIADCLIPLKTDEVSGIMKVGSKPSLLDIGSGGGLPGIPLALALRYGGIEPDLTVVERTGKKARFLERALDKLGIAGQVIDEDFQTSVHSGALKKMSSKFDLACLRWIRPDSKLIKYIISTLKPTGRFVYYASIPSGMSLHTDWSVSVFSYKLLGDERDSRTLTIVSSG